MRKALGLNQKELAARMGVDQSTVSDIERGQGLSAEILLKLADALNTTAAMVMRGHDDASWPFKRVPLEAFTSLEPEERGYVEGQLARAIADLTPEPTPDDIEVFNASSTRVRKPATRRKAA